MRTNRLSSRSEAQDQASRDNSQLSTGPITEEGKAASSMNAFKHGFTAVHYSTLDRHSAEILGEVQRQFQREFRPEGYLETDLLRHVADESFRLRQIETSIEILKLEGMAQVCDNDVPRGSDGSRASQFVVALSNPAFQRRFGLLMRYKGATERAFYRALATLKQTQKERRAEAQAEQKAARIQPHRRSLDFVSQKAKTRLTADPYFPETPPENDRN